jgi:hypothetical protein
MRTSLCFLVATGLLATAIGSRTTAQSQQANPNGEVRTIATTGNIDRRNPFFRPLGKAMATTCEHCRCLGRVGDYR